MADRTAGGAASEVVKAVLDVTPQTPEGWVATWYDDSQPGQVEVGSAEPIAARQAAAVLRWAVYNCEELWPQADPLAWISRLADEIDGGGRDG